MKKEILDKIYFGAKIITRQKETLYNDKMVNTPKRDSNPKCAHVRQHG